jgi:hypothetical protein
VNVVEYGWQSRGLAWNISTNSWNSADKEHPTYANLESQIPLTRLSVSLAVK